MAAPNRSRSHVAEAYCAWAEQGLGMVDVCYRGIYSVKAPLRTLLPHLKPVFEGVSERIQNGGPEALISPLAGRPTRPKGSGPYSNHAACSTARAPLSNAI